MEKPADASSGLGRRRATRWTLHFRSRLTSSTSDRSAKWDVQSALLSFRWPGAANQSSQGRATLHSLDLVYRVLLGFQREPYRVFTGLYRVLPSFTGFYWVLLGFTGFYWVLLGFNRFEWVFLGFTGFYWVLLGFTGFYGVLLGFTGFYWVLLGSLLGLHG